jgi:hypothetical protein
MISNDNKQIKSIVLFDSYKIEKTPNIYLFFLESYHSLDIQRNIYNINTEEIEIYLQRQQFKIYPEIYSNSSSTLQSFTDTFHFFATSEFVKGNSDAAISIRNLVCGDENNTLFKILKNNGYSTILLANSSYYGTRKGQNLDHSDFLPNEDTIAYYIYKSVVPLSSLNTRLHFLPSKLRPWAIQSGESTFFSDPLFNRVKQSFEIHKKTGVPIFVTFKGGACHTPPDGSYTWRNLEEWVESQTYQNAVKHANKELIEICDYIISQDPGSLIILIGDHGSWRLRGAENPASNREQLHQSLINNGISIDSFCKDIFGVFLAIRLPYGDTTDISQNMAMTHVNLFRHIFAYINKDLTILETRAPANCYYNSIPLIEDGKIIQPFK